MYTYVFKPIHPNYSLGQWPCLKTFNIPKTVRRRTSDFHFPRLSAM